MKKIILTILGYLLLFLLAVNVAVTAFVPEKSMEYLGYRSFIVLSDSMEPEINVKDLVVITKINEEDLEPGDIITFSVYIPEIRQKGFVTHYIADIQTDSVTGETIYKTQGALQEANEFDEWTDQEGNPVEITFDDIEGVHLLHIGYIGNIVFALRNPIFVVLSIMTLSVIVITTNYIKRTRDDEDLDDELAEDYE